MSPLPLKGFLIATNIVCHYGVLHELISDHGSHFKDETARLLEWHKVRHRQSGCYKPQRNGGLEDTSKTPFDFWGCRMNMRLSARAIQFSLTYEREAILPAEIKCSSLRVVLQGQVYEINWIQSKRKE